MTKNTSQEGQVGIIPTIFHLLGLIACTVLTFMGLAYTFGGNIFVAGFGALIALVILWVLANRLVVEKTTERRKQDNSTEYVLLSAYGCLFLVLFPFDFLSMDVEISQKEGIIKSGNAKIAHTTDLIAKFKAFVKDSTERLRVNVESNTDEMLRVAKPNKGYYLNKVKENLGEIKIDLSTHEASPDDKDIKDGIKKSINVSADLKITDIKASLYKNNLLQAFDEFEKESKPYAEKVFADWNHLRVGQEYAMLDERYKKLSGHIKSNNNKFQHPPIPVNKIEMNNPLNNLSQATASSLLLIVGLLVIIHLCLLATYIAVPRAKSGLKRSKNTILPDDILKQKSN